MRKSYGLGGRDLRHLFRYGKRIDTRFFRITYEKNNLSHMRLAVVVPRAVDKRSSARNLLRRRLRERLRTRSDFAPLPLDVAVLIKKDAALIARRVFYQELDLALQRLM